MDLRYKALFSLPKDQYAEGGPVIIREAAQLLDQLTGRVYVRVQLHSIDGKSFAKAAVTVRWQDGEVQALTCEPDEPRQSLAPYRETHPFVLQIDHICFADGTRWQGEDAAWQPLPERTALEDVLPSEEAAQYRENFGTDCKWVPCRVGDLFLCACGAVGREQFCHTCGANAPLLTDGVLQTLRESIHARRAEEERQREEARRQAEAEAQRQREQTEEARRERRKKCRGVLKRMGAAAAALVVLTVLAGAVFWYVTRIAIPADHYQKALTALELGNYREAHRQFTLAGSYKDASEYLTCFYTPLLSEDYTGDLSYGKYETHTRNHYDGRGQLVEYVYECLERNEAGVMEKTDTREYSIIYDERGNVLQKRQGDKVSEKYTYDACGSVLTHWYYDAEGTVIDSFFYSYRYDEAGRVIWRTEVRANSAYEEGSYTLTEKTAYNDDGLVTEKESVHVYVNGGKESRSERESWTYNARGQVLQNIRIIDFPNEPNWSYRESTVYEYDDAGRQIREIRKTTHPENPKASIVVTTEREFNGKGDVTQQVTVRSYPNDPDMDGVTTLTRTYNWEGKILTEKLVNTYADAETQRYLGRTVRTRYTYDMLGRLTEKRERFSYPADSERTGEAYIIETEYTYHADGMLAKTVMRGIYPESKTEGWEIVSTYNENGLEETEWTKGKDTVSEREYSYAYFYYPKGAERPEYVGW